MKQLLNRNVSPRAALVAGAFALAASVLMFRDDAPAPAPEASAPATRSAPAPARASAPATVDDLDLAKLQRTRKPGGAVGDLFPSPAPAPAPQSDRTATASAAAPQAPAAPPLPFEYLGKVIDSGKLTVFVIRGNEPFTLAAGKKLDDQYRVEKITEAAVTFKYLPSGTEQVLAVPTTN